jgi:large repetitive protein
MVWRLEERAGFMKFSVQLLAALFFACMAPAFPAAAQTVTTLSTGYGAPQYVTVNGDKTVFVTDTTYALSALFLVNGAYTTTPMSLTSTGGFSNPEGVAVDQGGDILAVTNYNAQNIGIWEFRPPDYANIYAQSLSVSSSNVQGAAFDSHGDFFFANNSSSVLEIPAPSHASAGSIVTGQSGIDHSTGIAFDSNDNLFVANQRSGAGQIVELTAASGYATLNTITSGNFQQPVGVALDSRGNLYVTDSAHNTLTELLAPNYTTAAVIDSTHFSGPMGVAIDGDDNIFVVDTGHNALKEIPAQPAVTGIAPVAGPVAGGTTVTITGVHLTGATAVAFGGSAAASFNVVSDSQVTATAPAGSGTVDVRVTTPNGTSIAVPADKYTYTSRPSVSGLNPSSGPTAGGNTVTINGSNLGSATGVTFGGIAASNIAIVNAGRITATTPAGSAGPVDVTVTTPGGTSPTGLSDQYTYIAAPTVSAVSPNSGPTTGGTNVTIIGTSFTGASGVRFGGAAATNVTVVSATSITATSPAGSAGIVDVTVTTADGTSATEAADGFTYLAFTLSAGVSGSGTVTSTPSGISCGSTCSASFGSGTQVTLNETPGNGWVFGGWSGACSGAGSCVVTMNASESVTASFLIAQGGLTRTFVSSSGADTNPCTVAAPCASFAHAFTLTQPNGIIAALDPGKYGPLTITYPVTINGNGWAAITAPASGAGITINADIGNVILTGLEVDGGDAAYNGIVFNSGASLTVSNCIVKDFISANSTTGNGIMIGPTSGTVDFTIVHTVTLNNASAGIHYLPASGSAAATGAIDHVIASNNAIGMAVDLSAASGGSAAVTISNSIANNNTSDGIVTASAMATVTVTADRDEISSNGTGVGVGANTTVLLSRSMIANNSTYGISNAGTADSSEDNRIYGNGNNVHGTALTSVSQQ